VNRWAILTSGGDAPGMNTAIWQFAHLAGHYEYTALGITQGFAGLLAGQFKLLDERVCLSAARRGGTWLGSSRLPDFAEHIDALCTELDRQKIGGLLILGGNGSLAAAARLAARGLAVVGIPATIDNDVAPSDDSIGFDTAVNSGLQLLDAMRDSAESLPRFFALETLGGNTGFLAQAVAEAGCADLVLLPEIPLPEDTILERIRGAIRQRGYALLVASEGYPELEVALTRLSERLGTRLRLSRIGHAQRGGAPDSRDRLLARRLVHKGCEVLAAGGSGVVGTQQGEAMLWSFDTIPPYKPLEPQVTA
jgi:6-phosphofructokinase 1